MGPTSQSFWPSEPAREASSWLHLEAVSKQFHSGRMMEWSLAVIATPWVTQGSSDVMEELGLCHSNSCVTALLRCAAELVSLPGAEGMVPVLLQRPQQELFLVRKLKCFSTCCQRPSVCLFAAVHPAGSWCRALCFVLSCQSLWHGQDEAAAVG